MESPPKRMTRARAAAKASEATVKTTKIMTAAARAKSTATAPTRSTSAKRKTRADEHEDGEEEESREAPVRRARGRPRKAEEPEPEPEATAKPTRGRVVKKTLAEAPKEEDAAPVKATRGRPRKVVAAPAAEEDDAAAAEPAKRATRGRPANSKSTATAATKASVKKSVTFQEPDKENVEPAAKPKQPAASTLRGRPARRTAAAVTRTTRAAMKSSAGEKKPLSPKKVTQMPISNYDSEDELAGDSLPVKSLMKNPKKIPGIVPVRKESPDPSEPQPTAGDVDDIITANMSSPAKRPPVIASPYKDALKSPARRVPLPGIRPPPICDSQLGGASSLQASLLQSPAKRPQSPIKGLDLGNSLPSQPQSQSALRASFLSSPAKRAITAFKPLTEPRNRELGQPPVMKPLTLGDHPTAITRPSEKLMLEDAAGVDAGDADGEIFNDPIESLQFPGRLSAVLPRHADPVLRKDLGLTEVTFDGATEAAEAKIAAETTERFLESSSATPGEPFEEPIGPIEEMNDPMTMDNALAEEVVELEDVPQEAQEEATTVGLPSPVQEVNPMYELRQKDLDPCHDMDSESEDEEHLHNVCPTTPTPFAHKTPKTQGTGLVQASSSEDGLGGFTALAERFGSWSAASPVKMPSLTSSKSSSASSGCGSAATSSRDYVISPHFFEDEMSVRPEMATNGAHPVEDDAQPEIEEPFLADISITQEDVALAQEANEMSLMEPEMLEEIVTSQAFDDTASEASQEYGDENEVPLGPVLAPQIQIPATPIRPMKKEFNTTTKVPLKPAHDATPSPLKKRSFTASRVAPKRPSGPIRNATVISYSPVKERKSMPFSLDNGGLTAPSTPGPITPSKSDLWSSMGTPARTPRRDVDSSLLRGAVVFVDVHTSEGADASSIFVELLTQMGAKCMKSWSWSPNASETPSNKIGITHVVYKDGGKRTLEKVRQTNGVVQCVGVSWVLDCERENEWLDESPYYINTNVMPRGGARRRKSMEPKALANMNGTLVSSPAKGEPRATPMTPRNRRESAQWMYTPSDQGHDDEEDDDEWNNAILTPVPKTPAPEAVARYAANLVPETPSVDDDDEGVDQSSPTKDELLMRTCPPKANQYRDLGAGILSQTKDDQVLVRLMAARRKSLQFAPKIGSPLARQWK